MRPSRRQFLAAAAVSAAAAPAPSRLYIGCYTNGPTKGILRATFDSATGALGKTEAICETPNPSFLALHPNRRYLYACNEVGRFKDTRAGSVSAFLIEGPDAPLRPLNAVSSKGPGPCDLEVDASGRMLVAANYSGGSTVSFRIHPDGSLSEAVSFIQHSGKSVNAGRQEAPHAHSVDFTRDNRFVVVSDLGADEVRVYRSDPASASLTANTPPAAKSKPGAGPRHFAFHPSLPSATR